MTIVTFRDSFANERKGVLRREQLDKFLLVDDFTGKHWLVLPEEVVNREEICAKGQDVEESKTHRKRGRPRKLGV